MEIVGKKALVLGGAGLVGLAVIRELARHGIKEVIISSLYQTETENAVADFQKEFPKIQFEGIYGNIFVPFDLKDQPRSELLGNSKFRKILVHDIVSPLSSEILQRSTLFRILDKHRPHIIVDAINSATALSYQDLFSVSMDIYDRLQDGESIPSEEIEKLLATQYTPQLIRHVQVLFESMMHGQTKMYVKIGTSGTGGMGLNIPYTHSEDKPSRILLAKSAMAGAHTLLMFLMARTPNSPIVKEIKPAAAIAWKKIESGPVFVKGKPVKLENVVLEDAVSLKDLSDLIRVPEPTYLKDNSGKERLLVSPFIDSGENGQFSRGEFEALTECGQMEFVTPEEIAQNVAWEITGRNTGHDVINALDNAAMSPTYRAGFLRKFAIDQLRDLESSTHIDSVAFENLGPPRLSKILHEAYLLRQSVRTLDRLKNTSAEELSKLVTKTIENDEIRSKIISIGLPILLSNGKLLRGQIMKIPARDEFSELIKQKKLTPDLIDKFAHDGWIDLRVNNMDLWRKRAMMILKESESIASLSSSAAMRSPRFWKEHDPDGTIPIGKVAGWIFTFEEEGARMKS